MELIPGFVSLLVEFREVFNVQSFPIFVELMTGWVLWGAVVPEVPPQRAETANASLQYSNHDGFLQRGG